MVLFFSNLLPCAEANYSLRTWVFQLCSFIISKSVGHSDSASSVDYLERDPVGKDALSMRIHWQTVLELVAPATTELIQRTSNLTASIVEQDASVLDSAIVIASQWDAVSLLGFDVSYGLMYRIAAVFVFLSLTLAASLNNGSVTIIASS
jgi:hypothetical protein